MPDNKTTLFRVALVILALLAAVSISVAIAKDKPQNTKAKTMKQLTPAEKRVIEDKGTEPPFSGKYVKHKEKGVYTCKRCGAPLFPSDAKFDSGTGWPSFDEALPNAIKKVADGDGFRTEIVCANCDAHLGHVFVGEGFTNKQTRHCVNSISLDFKKKIPTQTAIFAAGCFWGVEYHFGKASGVTDTSVGYTGGDTADPTYEEVCSGLTGHYEALKVAFNPTIADYEKMVRLFFNIHDPSQKNGQGPDIGQQYKSAIFYADASQKKTAESLIKKLEKKGLKVATKLLPAQTFWPAENYHQDYYQKNGKAPYCHQKTERFGP